MKYKDWDVDKFMWGGWIGTHPDYDPTPYDPDGVWGDNKHTLYGSSKDDVIKQIDEWEEGND